MASLHSQRFQLVRATTSRLVAAKVLPKFGPARYAGFAWMMRQCERWEAVPTQRNFLAWVLRQRAKKAARVAQQGVSAPKVAAAAPVVAAPVVPAVPVKSPAQLRAAKAVETRRKNAALRAAGFAAVVAKGAPTSGEEMPF